MMMNLNRNIQIIILQKLLLKNKNVHCINLKTETVLHNYNLHYNNNYNHKMISINNNKINLIITLTVSHNCKNHFHRLKFSRNLNNSKMCNLNNPKMSVIL